MYVMDYIMKPTTYIFCHSVVGTDSNWRPVINVCMLIGLYTHFDWVVLNKMQLHFAYEFENI